MPQPSRGNLNLWKRGLGRVPESVWDQTELETLVLADNGLTEVSERIGGLKRLSDAGPWAQSVDSGAGGDWGIGRLDGFLYLHDNRLSELPASIGRD